MPSKRLRRARSDPLKRLYARLYARSDLRGSGLGIRLVLAFGAVWLLCGVLNFAVLGRAYPRPRERAILAFGYGPAFVPLGLRQPRSTITVASKRIPVRAGAHLFGGGVLLLCIMPFLLGEQGVPRARWQRLAHHHAVRQGRLPLREVRKRLQLEGPGLPLALVEGEVIGIPFGADRGHVAVIGPTRSGKGLHLTETLLRWPGAAVVLDPKGEQWARTAGTRSQLGPVYRLPEQGIDLLDAFRMHDPLDVQELHADLLRTWKDREPIFGEKSLAIVHAAVATGEAIGEHPLQVLARWIEKGAGLALAEGFRYAPARILQFTDSDRPSSQELNKFAQSAWGTMTTRLEPLLAHVPAVTRGDVPKDWPARNATIYIAYPLDQVPTAGPLLSCIIAACIKTVMRQQRRTPVLFALDEVPATALTKLDTYMATLGSYGGTLLLYLQTMSQLDDVYGHAKAQTILGNCHTKVFYPPTDLATAEYVSKAFGTELRFVRADNRSSGGGLGLGSSKHTRGPHTSLSYTEKEAPALAPTELDALPVEAVIVLAQAETHVRVLAERLNPIPLLPDLPAPPALRRRRPAHPSARRTADSTPDGTDTAAPPVGNGAPATPAPDPQATGTAIGRRAERERTDQGYF